MVKKLSSFPLTYKGTTYMNMVEVPAGSFIMKHKNDSVKITFEKSFYMAEFPVTQEFYETVMENNPSHFKGKKRPVEQVSWYDAQVFIEKLNQETKQIYKLPSEAEWEYAACNGNKIQSFEFSGSEDIDIFGWYRGNSNQETKPVGLKMSNELGLYDMSGNIWEWCEDWYKDYSNKPENGSAFTEKGPARVRRGGSWFDYSKYCLSSYRYYFSPKFLGYNVGFRLCSLNQSAG